MAQTIVTDLLGITRILTKPGLGYLSLDRASSTLSTGERRRVQLSRAARSCTTGVLYVLDEPPIGLHPLDIQVLLRVLQRLIDNGATVVIIEHDLAMITNADYLVDLGPGGGEAGGRIVATGTPHRSRPTPTASPAAIRPTDTTATNVPTHPPATNEGESHVIPDPQHRRLRALGERTVAELEQRWRVLQHVTLSPSRIGDTARMALVLDGIPK